jgi:hypothetical protein
MLSPGTVTRTSSDSGTADGWFDPLIESAEFDAFLKIGDSISLFSIEGFGYLSSNGFIEKNLKLTKEVLPVHFSDCVFRIHPRYKYDQQKALNDVLTRLGKDRNSLQKYLNVTTNPSDDNEEEEEQLLQTLLQNEESEKLENASEFQRVAGKDVHYGQTIQLMHAKSSKYVTVTVKEMAELEKDCLRVVLDSDGNEGSWFVVTPRFKVRSEGEPVHIGDQIVLESKRYNLYLHVSIHNISDESVKIEVNASSETSGWRVIPYCAYVLNDHLYLKAGDAVRLFHEEAEGYITHEKISEEVDFADEDKQSTPHDTIEKVFLEKSSSWSAKKRGNSNSVWLVEFANTTRGGVGTFDKLYRFKHIATGKYLAAVLEERIKPISSLGRSPSWVNLLVTSKNEEKPVKFEFTTTTDPNSPHALFSVHPINLSEQEEGATIQIDSYVRLQHNQTQCWVHAEQETETLSGDELQASTQRNFCKLIGTSTFYDSDVFSFERVPKSEVDAIYQVNGQIAWLVSYVSTLRSKLKEGQSEEFQKVKSKHIIRVLQSLIQQVCPETDSLVNISETESTATASSSSQLSCKPNHAMQNLLREQRIMDVLVELLQYPFQEMGLSLHDTKKPEYYGIFTICRYAYLLLRLILKDNTSNRHYMAKYAKFIQSQVGYSLKATITLMELYQDNQVLLSKLTEKQIMFFINRLKEKGRGGRLYLKFLSIFCQCNGKPLVQNQNTVCRGLFSDKSQLLIPTRVTEEDALEIQDEDGKWILLNDFVATANEKLLDYFIYGIRLLADICLGGNMNTSGVVTRIVSPHFALLGLRDKTLPPSLRAAFGALLLNFHKASVANQVKPLTFINYTRLWSDVRQELTEAPFQKTRFRSSLHTIIVIDTGALKQFIFEYLQTNTLLLTSNVDINHLTCIVLVLCHHLFSLGLFTRNEIKELIPLLMHVIATVKDEKHVVNVNPYEHSEFTAAIMEAKLNVCYIFELLCDYRLDCRLTEILELFKHKMEGKGSLREITIDEKDRDKIRQIFEIFQLESNVYIPLLLDLIRHRYPRLATTAANLLIRHFSQEAELLKALNNVQILVDDKLVNTFQVVSNHIKFLRRALSSSNFKRQLPKVKEILVELTRLCISAADQNVASREHQQILRNLNTHEVIFELMKSKQLMDSKNEILTLCFEFLQKFCQNNPENQTVLFSYVNNLLEFLDNVDVSTKVSLTINEIFKENKTNCTQVTETQIRKFLNQVAQNKNPIFLDFFFTITAVNGRPLRRNQVLLASLLVEKQQEILFLYNDPESTRRRDSMIHDMAFLDPQSEFNFNDKLIRLFKRCCEGKLYEAEVKMQSLFDLDLLVAQIQDDGNWPTTRAAFINLLTEAYIETERTLKDIDQAPQIWNLFQIISQQIKDFLDSPFNEIEKDQSHDKLNHPPDLHSATEKEQDTHKIHEKVSMLQLTPENSNQNSEHKASNESKENNEHIQEESLEKLVDKRERIKYEEERKYIFNSVLSFIKKYFMLHYNPKKTKEKRIKTANKLLDALYYLFKNTKNIRPEELLAIGSCVEEMCKKNLTGIRFSAHISELLNTYKEYQSAKEREMHKESQQGNMDVLQSPQKLREDERIIYGLKLFRKLCASNFGLKDEIRRLATLFREDTEKHFQGDETAFTPTLVKLLGDCDVTNSPTYNELVVTSIRAFSLPLEEEITNNNPSALVELQNHMNSVGLTRLLFDLIPSRNDAVVHETLKLGIALLYGGNKAIQDEIYNYFTTSDKAETFFLEIRNRMRRAMDELDEKRQFYLKRQEHQQALRDLIDQTARHRSMSDSMPRFGLFRATSLFAGSVAKQTSDPEELKLIMELDDEKFNETGHITEILRFLQLLCEGHNLVMQNHLRLQVNNIQSYDLISETAACLESLESSIDNTNIEVTHQLFRTLTEYCQGPCPENQLALIQTKLCESINSIMRHCKNIQVDPTDVSKLKEYMLTTLLSLLEGNTSPLIPRHMLYALNFKYIEEDLKELVEKVRNMHNQSDALDESEVELGFLCFFLLCTLDDYDQEGKIHQILNRFPRDNIFAKGTGRVEIVRGDKLERVYFRILPVCSFLTEQSRKELVLQVKRDTQQDKIQDFFDKSEDLMQEMEHRERLAKNRLFSFLGKQENRILNFSFWIAVLINALIVATYDSSYNYLAPFNSWAIPIIFVLGCCQIFLSTLSLFIHIVSYAPLAIRKRWKSFGVHENIELNWKNLIVSLYFFVTNSQLIYHVIYVIFAFLGVWYLPHGPYFFAFHLLDIVVRNELLREVIKSVTLNGKSILLTALLAIVVVYIYAIFGFLFFRSAFVRDDQQICESMFMCLLTVLNYGLRSGGGVGDIMRPPNWNDSDFSLRVLYDSTFFFLVIIILLNIIFGIIIDTFGELRAQNKAIEEDIHNKCFICGIERDTFERQAEGFENHIKKDHNVWHYLYFTMYLKRKERTEYTGPEQYVADKIAQYDWGFVPILKAMCLDLKEEDSDRTNKMITSVEELTKQTKLQLTKVEKNLNYKQKNLEKKIADVEQKTNTNVQQMKDSVAYLLQKIDTLDEKLKSFEGKIDGALQVLTKDATTTANQLTKDATTTANQPTKDATTTTQLTKEDTPIKVVSNGKQIELTVDQTTQSEPSIQDRNEGNVTKTVHDGVSDQRIGTNLSRERSLLRQPLRRTAGLTLLRQPDETLDSTSNNNNSNQSDEKGDKK